MFPKMHFEKLDDSPMFRQQIQSLEENSESLRGRCYKFYKGCRKYTEVLGEGLEGDLAFADALDTFGGVHSDPDFMALGGPVLTRFSIALREIGMYKETLQSQVEHVLSDRLQQFVSVYLHDVKEARKRFDKASLTHDQAREKFLSLKKSTRLDVASVIGQELHNARSSYDEARFNLVGALSDIEAKKRFEFLEAVSGMMDAHLRYFKQGYELLHQMEPYINQILAYAQHLRESSNHEQVSLIEKMLEYKKQFDFESREQLNSPHVQTNRDNMQPFGWRTHKKIENVMQSSAQGKVQTIRQGYLSKRSSNLRGDWKRRFFVLDSRGILCYYRKQWGVPSSGIQTSPQKKGPFENSHGLWSRLLTPHHHHSGGHDERSAAHNTVNLLTSTIKIDADQTDLRFCFRIISPAKTYTLQAENSVDQMDWIEKITGVITSLLSFQGPDRDSISIGSDSRFSSSRSSSFRSSDVDPSIKISSTNTNHYLRASRSFQRCMDSVNTEKPIVILKKVCGNEKCADCGSPEPDWASLNLAILLCIECSGVHRNLGVHISKVRSLTLDVKVWDNSVLTLFESLGNEFTNSIWEELLHTKSAFQADENMFTSSSKSERNKLFPLRKPYPDDPISLKEKFIYAKYAQKDFIRHLKDVYNMHSVEQEVWKGVYLNDKKAVYRYVVSSEMDVNTKSSGRQAVECQDEVIKDIPDGCSLLHLACVTADVGMVELLLQYGATINASDTKGQTPLHYCAVHGKSLIAKMLVMRGANPKTADKEGNLPLELVSESASSDYELLALLTVTKR